jgi:hypothetical protein
MIRDRGDDGIREVTSKCIAGSKYKSDYGNKKVIIERLEAKIDALERMMKELHEYKQEAGRVTTFYEVDPF